MEITQEKQRMEYNDDIKKLMSIFKFTNNEIILNGSASLSAITYYSDYDFITHIKYNYSVEEVYDEFHKILIQILENNNCYFTEFKLQNIDGTKYKWFPNDNFKYSEFKNLFSKKTDFCKIDLVYFSNNRFIEASCIYKFYGKKLSKEEYIKLIKKDAKELKKENNYYKVLKRIYSINKLEGDNTILLLLTEFFNSEDGKIYKIINNLDAIEIIKKYYNDAFTKKRIETNLNDFNIPYNYEKTYKNLKEKLNVDAKKVYKQIT